MPNFPFFHFKTYWMCQCLPERHLLWPPTSAFSWFPWVTSISSCSQNIAFLLGLVIGLLLFSWKLFFTHLTAFTYHRHLTKFLALIFLLTCITASLLVRRFHLLSSLPFQTCSSNMNLLFSSLPISSLFLYIKPTSTHCCLHNRIDILFRH